MYKKLSHLSFVIGLFFSIVAVILFVTAFGSAGNNKLNLYTGMLFLAFGLFMMLIKTKEAGPHR